MTPLKIETIQDKLFRLEKNTDFIESIVSNDNDEGIKKDSTKYYSLEHMLQISIQIILDIGAHILAEEFNENPSSYRDIITTLADHKIIDRSFADEQGDMAKFRNKLIHDYDSIDMDKVLVYARQAPKTFRVFGKIFHDFIDKNRV